MHSIASHQGLTWAVLVAVEGEGVAVTMAGKAVSEPVIQLCSTDCSAPVLTAATSDEPVLACFAGDNLVSLALKDTEEEDEGTDFTSLLNVVAASEFLPEASVLTSDLLLKSSSGDVGVILSATKAGSLVAGASVTHDAVVVRGEYGFRVVSVDNAAVTVTSVDEGAVTPVSVLHNDDVSNVSGSVVRAFGGENTENVLVVTEGGVVQLVDAKKETALLKWASDESLSSITQAIFVLREEVVEDIEHSGNNNTQFTSVQ